MSDLAMLPPPTAPFLVAKAYLVLKQSQSDELTLHFWRGRFWRWDGTTYRELSNADIRRELYEFTDQAVYVKLSDDGKKEMPWLPNIQRVTALVDALKAACALDDTIEPHSWLDNRTTGRIVACRNGLLELSGRELIPHTPLFFNLSSLPFDYDPAATAPHWDDFMFELWGNGAEPLVLEEMMGAAVAGKLDHHRIPVLVGPKRAGKSLITSIWEELMGRSNIASPSLIGLTEDKTHSSLIGKSLGVLGDVRATHGRDPQIAEALLKISGGDSFTIDRKYRDPWIGRLNVMLVMVSNELPTIRDASGALPSRYLPLVLTKSFLGSEDLQLKDRLLPELPGILNAALDGLEHLERQGRFTEPEASLAIAAELMEMASPMERFLAERCVLEVGSSVPVRDLLYAYNEWATASFEGTVSESILGKRLHAAIPGLKMIRPRSDDGMRGRHYQGLHLASGRSQAASQAALIARRAGRVIEPADASGGGASEERSADHSRSGPHTLQ